MTNQTPILSGPSAVPSLLSGALSGRVNTKPDANFAHLELEALRNAHAFLVHEGHPTSAKHLEPLIRAATCAVMQQEARNA